jgi:hypothetical protein
MEPFMELAGSERRRLGREIDAFRIRGAASSAVLGLALPRTSSLICRFVARSGVIGGY